MKKNNKKQFVSELAVALYKHGMGLTDIAANMGYARGTGQNRVRRALISAGVYVAGRKTQAPKQVTPANAQSVEEQALAILKAAGKTPAAAAVTPAAVNDKQAATNSAAEVQPEQETPATTPANYPDVLAQECYNMVASRYKMLRGRARTGWLERLIGMLLAGMGETKLQKVQPVKLPEGLKLIRGGRAA